MFTLFTKKRNEMKVKETRERENKENVKLYVVIMSTKVSNLITRIKFRINAALQTNLTITEIVTSV